MAWRDDMQRASFRGVPFYVTQSDGEIGRRNVTHEYPQKDEAYVEDMGRKARSFTLICFVLGANYMAARDALEAAFEKAGPGELVHPWRGRMTVSVDSCRPYESIDQGGRQSWTVTFTQTGVNQQPSVRPDTQAIVDVAADNAIASIANDFAANFSVDGLPEFVSQDAYSQINTVLDNVLSIGRSMLPDMSVLPAFIGNSSTVLGKLTQIMRLPTNLAGEMQSQIGGLFGLANTPLSAFNALKSLFGFGAQSVNRTTPSRIQQDNNRQAIANLTRQTAVIEASRSSASVPFESQNQALAIRDTLIAAIDDEQLTASDEIYQTLADLRAAVVADINGRAADLAKLITYTPKATMPALALAYALYGDANQDAQIISRNNIAHPGFVGGGKPLEILTND